MKIQANSIRDRESSIKEIDQALLCAKCGKYGRLDYKMGEYICGRERSRDTRDSGMAGYK